jgi:RHS repeat-associated protein
LTCQTALAEYYVDYNAGAPDPLNQYAWHPYYIDALAMRWYDADTNGTSVEHYYLQDANFNVTAVTDNTGAVLERYAYTPYGKVIFLNPSFSEISASAIGNTHLYTGRERDPETGLQLNRHRFYANHLGGWLTRDPIEYETDNWNQYVYVSSQATTGIDPSGYEVCDACEGRCIFANGKCRKDETDPCRGPGCKCKRIGRTRNCECVTRRRPICECTCRLPGNPPAHCPEFFEYVFRGKCTAETHKEAVHRANRDAGRRGCIIPGTQIKHCDCQTVGG